MQEWKKKCSYILAISEEVQVCARQFWRKCSYGRAGRAVSNQMLIAKVWDVLIHQDCSQDDFKPPKCGWIVEQAIQCGNGCGKSAHKYPKDYQEQLEHFVICAWKMYSIDPEDIINMDQTMVHQTSTWMNLGRNCHGQVCAVITGSHNEQPQAAMQVSPTVCLELGLHLICVAFQILGMGVKTSSRW